MRANGEEVAAMKSDEILRAEAAIEMRDLAVRTVLGCIGVFGFDNWEQRQAMKRVLEHAALKVQALRLPPRT